MRILSSLSLALALTATLAFAADDDADASKWTFRTKEDCGVAQFTKEWTKATVKAMSWDGACQKKNRKLTRDQGTLTVKLIDGGQIRYTGTMKKGLYDEGEELAADGSRFVGRFMPWRDARAGQKFRADGSLEFSGEMEKVLAGLGYSKGRFLMPGGAYFVDGRFDPAAALLDLTTGAGISRAIAYSSVGTPVRYLVDGRVVSAQEFDQLATSYAELERSIDAMNQQQDQDQVEQERALAEQQRQKQEAKDKSNAVMWGGLSAALQGAATGRTGTEQMTNATAALNAYNAKLQNEALANGAGPAGGGVVGSESVPLSGTRGMSIASCQQQEARSPIGDQLRAVPPDDTVRQLRGIIVASAFMIQTYSQCLPDATAQRVVDEFTRTRTQSITTCRQITSDPGVCLVSPF